MSIRSVTYNTNIIGAGPYTITFPYLTEGDVEVYLDGVLNTAWTIASTTQLTLDAVPSEDEIEIRSNTQDEPYVDFTAPGPIPPENLDTAFQQSLYIAQEAKDSVEAVQDNVETEAAIRAAADIELEGQIESLSVGSGNVPPPSNPSDDGKILQASGGAYAWTTKAVTAAQISDSTVAGRAVVTAASNAAILSNIGAAAAVHVHAAADLTSGTIAQARLGTGSDGAGLKYLADDQTYKTTPVAQVFVTELGGLGLSNNVTDAVNDIDIAVGAAASNDTTVTDRVLMSLSSALVKRLDAAWAVGTNQGGLDTGAIADGTYHVWLIKRVDTGVVDVLFSASATAPTMPTNYTKKRRIGSILRESATIVPFAQDGDMFLRGTPIQSFSGASGTTAVTQALHVPLGIVVGAIYHISVSAAAIIYMSALTQADIAAVIGSGEGIGAASNSYRSGPIPTNTSAQVRFRSSAAVTLTIFTHGWMDKRGRS